jgi:hypothetical protein
MNRRLFAGSRSRGMLRPACRSVGSVRPRRPDGIGARGGSVDAGSIAGLKVNSPVGVEYEGASPRTAYVGSATRGFLSRNLRGIVVDGALYLGVLIGCLMVAHFIGKAWTRLVGRG